VNREERRVFSLGSAPLRGQDKSAQTRLSAASGHALRQEETALNTAKAINPNPNAPQPLANVHKHSTKRRLVFAGGWVDHDTDAFIHHRELEGKKLDSKYSRSRATAEMLKERAQDDVIERNSTLIVSMFRSVFREEFWAFANRFLAINARIAFWVGQSLHLQIQLLGLILRNNQPQFHQLLTDAKTDAKKDIRRHDIELGEVKDILLAEMEGGDK
jgi:hypothetical protein